MKKRMIKWKNNTDGLGFNKIVGQGGYKTIGLVVVLMGLNSTEVLAQQNDIVLKCNTTVYKDFLARRTDKGIENEFDMSLCNKDSTVECASKTEEIPGLDPKYEFNAYLTNDPGQSVELNISVVEYNFQGVPVSIGSRDLKNNGFLALRINTDYLMIGCGVKK